ncbi:spore coat protein CotJB [Ureibacillus manganicus]|uniref:Protein CotJB domain-containing protein n=1 Tax=Ureibacillus manganicus DSM 26584 TaxID=1384049 RepID=A0A0A3HVU6_9BACL|nr:spore coat protein CotJB [Ureibacillus manganicus]KGR76731.1 hypothetical protein CD29_16430 [Ureibacillus manganicus DSM 26584]
MNQQPQQPQLPPEYYQRLEEIQAIDFILIELNLYLDTHPNDQEAINQFNETVKKSIKLKMKFDIDFGLLINFGRGFTDCSWEWNDTPWPWQV